MRVLLTGASSFTGAWFAQALLEADCEVVAALRGSARGRKGVAAERLALVRRGCELVPRVPFGSPAFLDLLRGAGPFDIVAKLKPLARDRARDLRELSTEAERRLWNLVRGRRLGGYKFRRQHPIPPWTVDFACVEARLIVEADGGQHGGEADAARDRGLVARGWRGLRFWDNDILGEPDSLALVILDALRTSQQYEAPSPQPSPIALATGEGA